MDWNTLYLDSLNKQWAPTPKFDEKQEKEFEQFLKSTKTFEMTKQSMQQENSDVTDKQVLAYMNRPNGDYDYRGAYLSSPTLEIHPSDGFPHWDSVSKVTGEPLKSPYHPTAWKEYFMQQYGIDPYYIQNSLRPQGLDTLSDARMFNNFASALGVAPMQQTINDLYLPYI